MASVKLTGKRFCFYLTLGSGPRYAATDFRHSGSTLSPLFHWLVIWLAALSELTHPPPSRHTC